MDVKTIDLSACVAGVLDISATGIVMARQGVAFKRLLQVVASGALGKAAFDGGNWAAALGLVCHFVIAGIAATIYYLWSRSMPNALDRPVLFGAMYGVAVHLMMSRVVVPLSRAPKRQFDWEPFTVQLIIHILCVGVPIAVVQSRLSQS